MTARPISRSRIILAAMVPFVILALVGLGIVAHKAYKLAFWDRAEATYVGSDSGILVRGNSADHSFSQRHYRFAKKDGSEVQLYFLERGASSDKSMAVLYDPSVEGQITRSERDGYRWDRASNVYLLLFVGLGMAAAGLLPCLLGAALLVRERRRVPAPPPSPR